jgi:hypothetical protein
LEVFESFVFELGMGEFFVEFFDGFELLVGLGLKLLVVGVVE